MSSLTRPAIYHVCCAYGGLLKSPRQSLRLATLPCLLTVNLELLTISEGRQRLRGDLFKRSETQQLLAGCRIFTVHRRFSLEEGERR